jgi:DNA-binding XRE family transcriptional regulator
VFEVEFYRLPDGTVPVEEFLDSLDIKMRNKALDSLQLLEEFGNTRMIMKGDSSMSDLKKYMEKQLQNPEFRKEYEATRDEFEIVKALVAARTEANMTQKELAERSGIRQSNISRIERGACSPTIATLQALAAGMNKKLIISFK